MITQPIARAWYTIYLSEQGEQGEPGNPGADAEFYDMQPLTEKCFVYINSDNVNGTLAVQLQYNILHVKGATTEAVTASSSGYHIRFRTNISATYYYLSNNVTNPSYTNASFVTNYHTATNKPEWLIVELCKGSSHTIVKQKIIPVIFNTSLLFDINEELNQISSTVQGHETAIGDLESDVTTITNNMSNITQTMNQISSTVSSHTTQIDNLNSSVNTNTSNISNLTQTASQIQSTVTSINSSINGINSSISSITQRADSIESTVKSLNSGTTNYFHFVGTTWQNAIPYIQEYGLEGVDGSTINRISNLGFNGENGEFIVTCEMRMQTSGASITVDLCDRNAEYGAGSFGLGTTWVKKVFQFKNVSNYNTPGNFNGFIDFTGGFTNTNRLYVRKLCITKGTVAQEFITSVLDTQNHNSDNITNLVFSNISTTSKAYKGYDVYSPTVYNTSGTDTTDYIYQNNMTLKTNTVYTLSFWASSQQSNVVIASYLYGNGGCVDGTILPDINSITRVGEMTSGNNTDGATYSYLGSAYKHYIIHWYNKNTGKRNLLVMRTSHDWWKGSEQPNIKITGIEFREGYWVEDELNTQSMIRQTASEIELKVNNTGINIEDGSITLNANNTTVIGNLNIRDTKQGIIIYDQNNAPRISIQGEELGNLNTSTFGIDNHYHTQKSVNTATATTFDNINIGSYTAGQTIEISLAQINQNGISNGTAITSLTYSYQLLRGSTVVKTISGNGDSSSFPTDLNGNPFIWKLNTTTYSVTTAGTYYIKCTFTPNSLSSSTPVEFKASFYVKSSQSNIQKIGLDGAIFAHNQTNYNWFGADQTKLSYGNSFIQLDNNGVLYKPNDTTNAAEIGSITQVKTIYNAITSYNATLYEGFIIVNPNSITSTLTIQLPVANTCAGKKYFIKNMTSQTVQVTEVGHSSTLKSMVKYDSTTTTEYITVDTRPSIFISSGLYWIEFYS